MRRRSRGRSGDLAPICRRTRRMPARIAIAASERVIVRRFTVPDAVDCNDAKSECGGARKGALPIERGVAAWAVRQCPYSDHQRRDAEGHVDGKEIRPGGQRQDGGRERRADSRRDCNHQCIEADAAAKDSVRICEAYQSGIHAHDSRCAKPLDHARDGQPSQIM